MTSPQSDAAAVGSTVGVTRPTPPPPLNPEADAASWRRWKKVFHAYAPLTKLSAKAEEEREAAIFGILGIVPVT